jgi:hypothetical protein
MVKYKPKIAKAKHFLSDSNESRKGFYTKTEIEYLDLLIKLFKNNMLNIPDNYPMRMFLARCLGRNEMSLSKRFKKEEAIGKQRSNSSKIIRINNKKANEFLKIQSAFKNTLTEKEKLKMKWPGVLLKQKTLIEKRNEEIKECLIVLRGLDLMNIFLKIEI